MEAQAKTPGGLAITALVIGIIAFLMGWTGVFAILPAILAIVFGIIALVKKQSKGMGIAGIVLGSIAFITAIIITMVGIAFIGSAVHVGNEINKEQQTVKDTKKDFSKGETAIFNDLSVQAVTVTPNWQANDGYSKPNDGNQYVFVTLAIKNTGTETVSVNPYDFKLNADGVVSSSDIVTTPNPLNAVDLKAGASIQGDLVYQVKAASSQLKIEYSTYNTKAYQQVDYSLAL
jgi:archaellum component FlaG (FlaF/FlaG flagellin family)